MELSDSTPQKGYVKLLRERWEAESALKPSLELRRPPAPRSLAPGKSSRGSTVQRDPADGGRAAGVVKEEPLGGTCQIEPFSLTVKGLKSHFEALAGREFPSCTQAEKKVLFSLRRENKCEKGCLYQPFQVEQMKEALRQPKSTMPSVASKIKAINTIVRNHHDGARRPHHQGTALPVQEAQTSQGCVIQMLPQRQQPQMREPLRQPKNKINCAASMLKAVNEIHRNLKLDSQRPPEHQGNTFPDENMQRLETTKSEKVNKDTRRTVKKKKRISKDNQQDSNGNVLVKKHSETTTDVSHHDLQSACCAECTTGLQ